ncbi:hypothetical protein DL93DRAFT_2124030 [Clavulina sp. PMI_390]|nr:hypothetical protein DL93DRAFT_2124030 [Clavulina sp. PMI_390]
MAFSANIAFSRSSESSYRLIELPPDLVPLFEQRDKPLGSITVKGRSDDDAVLCTNTATYAIRSISVSNTIAVISPSTDVPSTKPPVTSTPVGVVPSSGEYEMEIRDQLHEFLELLPTIPRLGQLEELLKGTEFQDEDATFSSAPTRKISYEQTRSIIQASDAELNEGLRKARVMTVEGQTKVLGWLRSLSLDQLSDILQKTLNILVAEGHATFVPVPAFQTILQRDHGLSPEISDQVMRWFGPSEKDLWEPDYDQISKVIGLSLLSKNKNTSIAEDLFMSQWRDAVGDAHVEHVNLPLLTGNYLSSATEASTETSVLWYFPSSELSINPVERFKDLFLTRTKWRSDDLVPFINDLTLDTKARDKLLLKFCRPFKDEKGQVWYTGRGNY